jgi:hypothetical protein
MEDRTIEPGRGTALSLVLSLGIALLVLLPYHFIWSLSPIAQGWRDTSAGVVFLAFVLGLVVHELIHAVTWFLAGRLTWSSIAFGVNWSVLTPFAHAKVPLPINAYRIGAAMPGLLLGVIPVLLGVALGWPRLFMFGGAFLGLAAGDLLILMVLAKVPSGALVQDHPSRFGCSVLTAQGAPTAGLPGHGAAVIDQSAKPVLVPDERKTIKSAFALGALAVAFLVAFTAMVIVLVIETTAGRERGFDFRTLMLCAIFGWSAWHFWSRRRLPMKASHFAAFALAAVLSVSATTLITTLKVARLVEDRAGNR